MNEHHLNPLPPDVEALLQMERLRPGPSAQARQRVLLSAAAIAVPPSSSPPTPPTGGSNAAANAAATLGSGGVGATVVALSTAVKVLSGAIVLATGVGVYSWVRQDQTRATTPEAIVSIDRGHQTPAPAAAPPVEPPRVEPAPVQAPTVEAPKAEPLTTEPAVPPPTPMPRHAPKNQWPTGQPAPAASPPPQSPNPAETKAATTTTNGSTLAAEHGLLAKARAALAQTQPAAALAATEEHARQFPHGMLSEERETLVIRALVQANRVEEARQRGKRFRQEFPTSIYLPAVEETLSSIP